MTQARTPDTAVVLDALVQLPIERAMGRDHLARLAEIGGIEAHGAGQILFSEGGPADQLRIVISGRVSLTLGLPGREPKILAALSRGDMLGWSALRNGDTPAQWTASARASKASRCLVFPADTLRSLCESDHHLGYCVMRHAFEVVAHRLRDTRMQLLDIYCRPSDPP